MFQKDDIILKKYRVIKMLGSGGGADVYEARSLEDGKVYALKVVEKLDGHKNDFFINMLKREYSFVHNLKHKNITYVKEFLGNEKIVVYAMDLFNGGTLEDVLRSGSPMSESNVIQWADQLCDVLDYLHTRRPPIVHCDVKPSNILIGSDNNIKLVDFGSARFYGRKIGYGSVGKIITRGYSAPELYMESGDVGPAADIYSFGATLYKLLTGITPQAEAGIPWRLNTSESNISENMRRIITRCTMYDPDDRYKSFKEIKNALHRTENIERISIRDFKSRLSVVLGKKDDNSDGAVNYKPSIYSSQVMDYNAKAIEGILRQADSREK